MTKRILWLLALLPSLAFGGLEDLTGGSKYIDDLVATNPLSNDAKSEGDDHIRGVKNVLKNTFPNVTGPVTATQTELNTLDGVTSSTAELNILDGVTATAAELNYNDITTLGTAQASKAVTASAGGAVTINSGTVTLGTVDINGGAIDGTTIGGSSAAAGNFTTITASSTITSSAENGTFTVQDAATFNGSVDLSNGASDVIRIPSTLPSLKFYENDQGANNKVWSFYGQGAAFGLRLEDDSYGAGEIAWTCSRSDTAVGTCTFDNGAVQIDETLNVSQSITANSNFFNVNTVPYYGLVETDAAANNQRWAIMSNATQLAFRAFDDSWSANEAAIVINRSGTNITSTQIDNGDLVVDEGLTHNKACATNYTRAAPGICVLTTSPSSVTNLTRDTCTSITFPAGATFVMIRAEVQLSSAGSAGGRTAALNAYSNTGCSTFAGMTINAMAYEASGTPSAFGITANMGTFILPSNANYRLQMTDDSTNKGSAWFNIPMYWDN